MDPQEKKEQFSTIFASWNYEPNPENQRDISLVNDMQSLRDTLRESFNTTNSLGQVGLAYSQVLRSLNDSDQIKRAENFAIENQIEEWPAWKEKKDQESFLFAIMTSVYARYVSFLLESGLIKAAEISGPYNYFVEKPVQMCILNENGEEIETCEAKGFRLFLGVHSNKNIQRVHVTYFTPDSHPLNFKIEAGNFVITSMRPIVEGDEEIEESSESFKRTFMLSTNSILEEEAPVRNITPIQTYGDIKRILNQSTDSYNSQHSRGFPRMQVCRQPTEEGIRQTRAEELARILRHNIFAWNRRSDQEMFLAQILTSEYGNFIHSLLKTGFIETAEIIGSYDDFMDGSYRMSVLNGIGRRSHELITRGFHLFLGVHENSQNLDFHVKFFTPDPYRRDLAIIVGDWKIMAYEEPDSDDEEEDDDDEPISLGAEVYNVPSLHEITEE